MIEHPLAPPPVLDCARVIAFAILNDSIKHSGRTSLYVGGKAVGAVPRLAICGSTSDPGVFLFHCDTDWNVLGTATYKTVVHAKQNAEVAYPGIAAWWVDTGVTPQEAEKYLDEEFAGECCSFCGRRPDQSDQMISKDSARICNRCIDELYREIHE